jgi:carboxyl-terminal processing protease
MFMRRFSRFSLVAMALLGGGVLVALPLRAVVKSDTFELLALFSNVFDRVKKEYVSDVSDEALIEAALNGMLTSLDPHSSYLNEKAFDDLKMQTKGEFGGLGIEVTMDNGLIKVISPIDDTPAFRAGIQAGDYIFTIDDEAVFGMTLNDAVDRMRGKPGTKINLTILREGQSEPMAMVLNREIITVRPAKSKLVGDIGYIRINSFSEQTSKSLESEYRKLSQDSGHKLMGLVLDLRNNPGGLLDQAVEVADNFLENGEIVSTRGRANSNIVRFAATKGDITGGLPLVVLINGGSASASEIVAGALQDHRRGVILGTKSFGKGSVQTLMPIPGYGAIRLTTARYFTPFGREIQAEGITPDIEVKPAKIDSLEQKEALKPFSEATLHKHLINDKDKAAASEANGVENAHKATLVKSLAASADDALYASDFQLARAVDLLRGLHFYRSQPVLKVSQ